MSKILTDIQIIGTTSDALANALDIKNISGDQLFISRNDGFIGIGTSTLSAKLTVSSPGSTLATKVLHLQSVANTETLNIYDDGTSVFNGTHTLSPISQPAVITTKQGGFTFQHDSNILWFIDSTVQSLWAISGTTIAIGSFTTHDVDIRTTNTSRLLIQASSGFIGINSGSPTANLFIKAPDNSSSNKTFKIEYSADSSSILECYNSLQVGIGTNSISDFTVPNVSLTNSRFAIKGTGLLHYNDDTLWLSSGVLSGYIQPYGADGTLVIGMFTDHHLSFYTNNTEKVRIDKTGIVGFGTINPTSSIDILGTNGYSQFRMRTSYTPTSNADVNGNTGDVSWDETYLYIKTSGNGWGRISLSFAF